MRKVITAIVLLLAVLLAACSGTRSTPENVAQELGVSLPETVSVGYEDTHGGFHGDGETWIALNFTAEGAEELRAAIRRRLAAFAHGGRAAGRCVRRRAGRRQLRGRRFCALFRIRTGKRLVLVF